MKKFLVILFSSILIFAFLVGLSKLNDIITKKGLSLRRTVILVFLSIIISGIGGFFSEHITNLVKRIVNIAADVVEVKVISSDTPEYIHITDYVEGYYYGEILEGVLNGKGRLVYIKSDADDDDKQYTIEYNGGFYEAIYYDGYFKDGWRDGEGTVVYEGGFKDVGEFYGKWEAGKTVFDGIRYMNDEYKADLEIVAVSADSARDNYRTNSWIAVDE